MRWVGALHQFEDAAADWFAAGSVANSDLSRVLGHMHNMLQQTYQVDKTSHKPWLSQRSSQPSDSKQIVFTSWAATPTAAGRPLRPACPKERHRAPSCSTEVEIAQARWEALVNMSLGCQSAALASLFCPLLGMSLCHGFFFSEHVIKQNETVLRMACSPRD